MSQSKQDYYSMFDRSQTVPLVTAASTPTPAPTPTAVETKPVATKSK